MLIDEEAIEPADAGPGQVAALHDDRRVVVALDVGGDRGCRARRETPCSGGGAGSALTAIACLPSARSAYAIASCEPIESPSGRECEESTKRRRARIASTMR